MAGRPRQQHIDSELLDATRSLLAECGYAATTVDGICRRAVVPKTALYRRWPTKAELVFAAVVHGPDIDCPDTGALASDLRELATRVVATLNCPAARRALPGLLSDLAADVSTLQRFRTNVLGSERALLGRVLDRAVTRGDLDAAVRARADDTDLHAHLLGAVLVHLVLLDRSAGDLPDRLAVALLALIERTPDA